ncbi:hypothetical protein KI387_006420, partial [Taxus chinensis]
FDVTIVDKPKKENVVAYFLSQMDNNDGEVVVDDSFPYENLFTISTKASWYVDIANYLAS